MCIRDRLILSLLKTTVKIPKRNSTLFLFPLAFNIHDEVLLICDMRFYRLFLKNTFLLFLITTFKLVNTAVVNIVIHHLTGQT